jgi:hypothetical protein
MARRKKKYIKRVIPRNRVRHAPVRPTIVMKDRKKESKKNGGDPPETEN